MKGNLVRVVRCLTGYYRQQLGLLLHTRRMPDLTQLARLGEEEEVDTLIRLILGVAVTCSHRANHIKMILSLNIKVRTPHYPTHTAEPFMEWKISGIPLINN